MSIKKTSAILHDTHDIHVKQFHYWNEFPLNKKIDTRKIYSSAQFPELNTDLLAIHFFSKIQELIILLAWIIKSLFCTSNLLEKKKGFWEGLMYMAFNLLNILCILGFVCVCAGDYTDVPWWCAYTGGCWFHHHDGSNLELLMVSFSTCPHTISPSAAITVYFIFWAFYSSTVSQVRWSNVSRKKKTILYKGGVMIREFLMAFKKIKPPEEKKTKSSAAALQVCSFS